jgi:signal transduction histidine kinase
MVGNSSIDRFLRFFEFLEEGFVVLNQARILQVNAAWAKLVGVPPLDLVGQELVEFIATDAREEILQRISKGDAGPYPSLLQHGRQQAPVPVRVQLYEFAEDGRHVQFLVMKDMRVEMKRNIRARAHENTDAELQSLRAYAHFKTNLLNTAAHELNTPITPLRLQAHLLTSGGLGPLNGNQQRAVSILDRNIRRLSILVNGILDVARLDSGNLRIEKVPVDVGSVIDEVFESFQDAAQQVGITLQRKRTRGFAVYADPDRLVQVFYNLISNAIKFTPAKGIIKVDTSADSDTVTVDVIDSGVGLTPEEAEMLFKPFSQAHDPKDFMATGTGLGLYISRGIIEAQGGTMSCTSDGPGDGSTFTFKLPRSHADHDEWIQTNAPQSMAPQLDRQDELLERLRELI